MRPRREEELADLLRECHAQGTPVALVGGGTHLGSVPAELPEMCVETGDLSGIVEHDAGDLTVTARAGTTLAELQAHLAEHGQQVALDAEDPTCATLGGILATDLPPRRRLPWKPPRDQVLGLRVVHADGTSSRTGGRVVKNVTGYDLAKIYCGSRGALVALAEVTLRVHPLEDDTRVAWKDTDSWSEAHDLALKVRETNPTSLDLLDAQAASRLQPDQGLEEGVRVLACWRGPTRSIERRTLDAGLKHLCSESPTTWLRLLSPRTWLGGLGEGATLAVHARPSRSGDLERALAPIYAEWQPLVWKEHVGESVHLVFERVDAARWSDLIERLQTCASGVGGHARLENTPEGLRLAARALETPAAAHLERRLGQVYDPAGILFPGALPSLVEPATS